MAHKKDHDGWNSLAKKLEGDFVLPFFKEREVWWVAVGTNIGHEEDGKGELFSRPVLILKKFGKHTFIGIPLSTNRKVGKLYYGFNFIGDIQSTALLGHIRSFDSRRLVKKYGIVDKNTFQEIRKAVKDLL